MGVMKQQFVKSRRINILYPFLIVLSTVLLLTASATMTATTITVEASPSMMKNDLSYVDAFSSSFSSDSKKGRRSNLQEVREAIHKRVNERRRRMLKQEQRQQKQNHDHQTTRKIQEVNSTSINGDSAPETTTTLIGSANGDTTPLATGGRKTRYVFAVVPKSYITFFEPTESGCHDMAARIVRDPDGQDVTVECLYIGPENNLDRDVVQGLIVEEILWGGNPINGTSGNPILKIDGLAVSVVDAERMAPIMRRAKEELNIPVVTFDSDAPDSGRSYYIGTNNSFFGRQLARQMESLNPAGGTFGIIGGESTNLQDRANGILQELIDQQTSAAGSFTDEDGVVTMLQNWEQLPSSPFDADNNQTLALQKLDEWAQSNPTVLLSVTGLPMRSVEILDANGEVTGEYYPWQDFVDNHRHRNITLLCADASEHQLTFLEYDYVDGLAGQLPYDMGIKSIEALWELYHAPEAELADEPGGDFIGTNVLWHVHIPLKLPPIEVDMNRVGDLQYVGYTLFAIISFISLGACLWVFVYRHVRVVRVAQPGFLAMIAIGVMVMTACIVPLGMDDLDAGGYCDPNEDFQFGSHCRAICMSVPWLAAIGFTLVFSALFSKTWRINKIFKSDTAFSRVKVSEMDVLKPFLILLVINVTILLSWTIIDPMTYQREDDLARDEWNRVISTYGICKSENVLPYLIPLIVVNVGVLIMANYQAYEARDIEAEFSESKYITICMASMLQAMISGVPVLFFVRDMPQAYYMVFVLLCFIIGMVILIVIFIPKMMFAHQFLRMTPAMQKQYMAQAIGRSAKASLRRTSEKSSALSGRSTRDPSSNTFVGGTNNNSTSEYAARMPSAAESCFSDESGLFVVRKTNRPSPTIPQFTAPNVEKDRRGSDSNPFSIEEGNEDSEVSDNDEFALEVKTEPPPMSEFTDEGGNEDGSERVSGPFTAKTVDSDEGDLHRQFNEARVNDEDSDELKAQFNEAMVDESVFRFM